MRLLRRLSREGGQLPIFLGQKSTSPGSVKEESCLNFFFKLLFRIVGPILCLCCEKEENLSPIAIATFEIYINAKIIFPKRLLFLFPES